MGMQVVVKASQVGDETRWQRVRHKNNHSIEYDVEVVGYFALVEHDGPFTAPHEKSVKIRTVKNLRYEFSGEHTPSYTMMPLKLFGKLYERVDIPPPF